MELNVRSADQVDAANEIRRCSARPAAAAEQTRQSNRSRIVDLAFAKEKWHSKFNLNATYTLKLCSAENFDFAP